jgi:RimJ/RimL family protein N-acetyltransferase
MELARTERTILREWTDDEADRLLDILRRPEVMRWIDDDQDDPELMQTRDEARARIARYRTRNAESPPRGFWAVEERATGRVVGTVLLTHAGSDPDEAELEIGWHLHPDSWGHGYAREAARALLDVALASGIPRVHALMYVDNEPSAAVATAIGMVEQPILVDRWYPGESRHFLAEATPST